jgi:ElaB/YqjD/DUF883 family membrane-anchored ribosome-binding protein
MNNYQNNANKIKDEISDSAKEAKETLTDTLKETKEKLISLEESFQKYTKENPWKAVAWSILAGAVVSKLFSINK